jgi:hypothetical protein
MTRTKDILGAFASGLVAFAVFYGMSIVSLASDDRLRLFEKGDGGPPFLFLRERERDSKMSQRGIRFVKGISITAIIVLAAILAVESEDGSATASLSLSGNAAAMSSD